MTGRWVIIASDRAKRPSDFTRQPVVPKGGIICPFCPGNEKKTPPEVLAFRQSGAANEAGWTTRVVPNKFPALGIEGDLNRQGDGMYDRMDGIGVHEVIIESPEHMATLGEMSEKQIADIFWAWRERMLDLKRDQRLRYVLVFKNHGEAAGATLEHPHSQLIGLPIVPIQVQEELDGTRRYFDFKERCVYCDMIRQELDSNTRIVLEAEHCVAIEPYAPRFAFETWFLPTKHTSHFERDDAACVHKFAGMLRTVVRKLDKVLEKPAYNIVLHSAPLQDESSKSYHWHMELIPKLSKVAGFECGSGFYINPTPPEESARFLREVGLV